MERNPFVMSSASYRLGKRTVERAVACVYCPKGHIVDSRHKPRNVAAKCCKGLVLVLTRVRPAARNPILRTLPPDPESRHAAPHVHPCPCRPGAGAAAVARRR